MCRNIKYVPSEMCAKPSLMSLRIGIMTRVFVVRMKNLCIIGYPKRAQWRFWSDCAIAQSDLNLRWAHMSKGTFSNVQAQTNPDCTVRFTLSGSALQSRILPYTFINDRFYLSFLAVAVSVFVNSRRLLTLICTSISFHKIFIKCFWSNVKPMYLA